jgi:pilus assembly protein CpaC
MNAGQTLAIAGLVQNVIDSEVSGIPILSEIPYLGMFFRSVKENNNEVELIVLVTPELVEAQDAGEVPQCLPGMATKSPSDWELYFKGHLEVPNCCPPGPGGANGAGCPNGCPAPGAAGSPVQGPMYPSGMPAPTIVQPPELVPTPAAPLPPGDGPGLKGPQGTAPPPSTTPPPTDRPVFPSSPTAGGTTAPAGPMLNTPAAQRNRYSSSNPQTPAAVSRSQPPGGEPAFIGPVGYDVQ